MAKVERRAEELLKGNSLQGLLDLEKERKMDRLRGQQSTQSSPQLHPKENGHPPPRPECPGSSSSPETFLMVKPTRNTAVPALSISIPQNTSGKKATRPTDGETEQETGRQTNAETPTASEPHHKQVTFLDDEDSMSDQSSICQSPSWENYGQRKKEKKLEAERRKREKEQAEKELKAARKRAAARLSKLPPPPATTNPDDPRGLVMTAAERSMSDTSLVSRRNLQGAPSLPRFAISARAASSDNVPNIAWPRPPVVGLRVALDASNAQRPGGGATDDSSTQDTPRSSSGEQKPPSTTSAENESRLVRLPFRMPPVRAPRQQSTSPLGRTRGKDVSRAPGNPNTVHESLPASPSDDSVRTGGYVHHQRAQATQRAIASLVDEHLIAKASQCYPPVRPSATPAHRGRRSSLTMEAKSVAMKLMNLKAPAAAKEHTESRDCAEFKAIPYSSSSDVASSESAVSMPTSLSGTENPCHNTSAERSPTPQSSTSSSVTPTTGSASKSQNRKSRSLMDAAKAALSLSKPSRKHTDGSKATAPLPPQLPTRSPLRPGSAVQDEAAESNRTGTEGSSSAASSAKDVPLAKKAEDNSKSLESHNKDPEVGHSFDPNKSSTPPAGETSVQKGTEPGEDEQWSRTAIPIDIEADTESVITTMSNQERAGEGDSTASAKPLDSRTERPTRHKLLKEAGKASFAAGDGSQQWRGCGWKDGWFDERLTEEGGFSSSVFAEFHGSAGERDISWGSWDRFPNAKQPWRCLGRDIGNQIVAVSQDHVKLDPPGAPEAQPTAQGNLHAGSPETVDAVSSGIRRHAGVDSQASQDANPGHPSKPVPSITTGRPAIPGGGEGPIAKILVQCCSCKFYHDMPSKLYECIAKPDAVVEDRALGISGAITTMVKCHDDVPCEPINRTPRTTMASFARSPEMHNAGQNHDIIHDARVASPPGAALDDSDPEPVDITAWQKMLSATSGSLLTALLATPLDVVRVRWQSQNVTQPPRDFTKLALPSNLPFRQTDLGVTACCREVFFSTNTSEACFFGPRPLGETSLAGATATAAAAPTPSATAPAAAAATAPNPMTCAVQQTQQRVFTSTFDGLRKIARNEGITTLWRGLSPTLIMAIPANIIYFTGYEWLRFNRASPIARAVPEDYAALIAGSAARVLAATAVSPIELFRTRLQALRGDHGNHLVATFRGVRDMVAAHGYRSLWRGLTLTLWRDVPFSGMYWWGYETIRDRLADARARRREAELGADLDLDWERGRRAAGLGAKEDRAPSSPAPRRVGLRAS
ncbi:hypothetical protein VTJ49DRAFT_4531 [Mycothermus thermophilus]|uniref:Mitochondrial carrier protein n=1 Tax=Humicola insolens TaxID=85995 RepID=A0ABR3V555_HUMIN